jgi:hypothetical protein
MNNPTTTTPPPKPKPGAKGQPISEDDDFGEATFARALKTVKEAIAEASPEEKAKRAKTPKKG